MRYFNLGDNFVKNHSQKPQEQKYFFKRRHVLSLLKYIYKKAYYALIYQVHEPLSRGLFRVVIVGQFVYYAWMMFS